MTFRTDPIDPKLPEGEYDRLVKLLAVHYSYPLPYPLAGAYFEELFAAAIGGVREERKLLFDCLRGATGWSLKTLLWPRLAAGTAAEVVVQRCDILKNRDLSLSSPVDALGAAIVAHFNAFCELSRELQEVTDQRAGFLIRDRTERQFVFFQQRYRLYAPNELRWQWANDGNRSLVGYTDDDQLVFRWYRSGTQLFGVYRVPEEAHQFQIDWRRAGLDETIAFFTQEGITRLAE